MMVMAVIMDMLVGVFTGFMGMLMAIMSMSHSLMLVLMFVFVLVMAAHGLDLLNT